MSQEIFKWADKSPPRNTWVHASYGQDWFVAQTCKQGCCIHSEHGNLMLPLFWYLAKEPPEWSKNEIPLDGFFESYPESTIWLASIKDQITNSIAKHEDDTKEWISQEVAIACIKFFNNTAYFLPCEPYLSSTLKGDLIAEFESNTVYKLTIIISPIKTWFFCDYNTHVIDTNNYESARNIIKQLTTKGENK